MTDLDHYHTLEVDPTATQAEIKQAYRRLAKQFHPDSNPQGRSGTSNRTGEAARATHDKIVHLNAAYEILGDPQRRQMYDRQRQYATVGGRSGRGGRRSDPDTAARNRHQRTARAQEHYHQQQSGQQVEEDLKHWLQQVYTPTNRLLLKIIKPLRDQIDDLSADPFDDELMEDFQDYLDDCRDWLSQAEALFRSRPNPSLVAGAAANLFYCLTQLDDGIEQLQYFTANYDEYYLHTGEELFRIAKGLRQEAQAAVRAIATTL